MNKFNFILEYSDYIKNVENLSLIKDKEIYNDFKNTIIIEGLIKTHPNNLSLDIILKRYTELKGNIEPDGEIYLEGEFRELSNYLPIINNLGYFISTLTLNGSNWIKEFDENTKPIAMFLEPKYDIKINKLPTILYHATLKRNKNSILKYGLVPKNISKLSNHPDRIYLTDNYKMAYLFGFNFKEPFIILEIDTNNLNIELYRDINALTNSYYTLDNIKKQKIRIIYDSLK
jgi:hypothetical protein